MKSLYMRDDPTCFECHNYQICKVRDELAKRNEEFEKRFGSRDTSLHLHSNPQRCGYHIPKALGESFKHVMYRTDERCDKMYSSSKCEGEMVLLHRISDPKENRLLCLRCGLTKPVPPKDEE